MIQTADAIVMGVGGVGSAALSHLATAGADVIGIDRFVPGHDQGSSHGGTRIIRTAYFEHPDYVPLAQAAFDLWQDLERQSGQSLLNKTGLFVAGRSESEAVQGTIEAAGLHDLEVEILAIADAQNRWPGFQFRDDEVAIFEKEAGTLSVEDCVCAHVKVAQQHGAVLRTSEAAYRWGSNGRRAFVETDRGRYESQTLIITVGAWAGGLLPELLADLQVLRKVQVWVSGAKTLCSQAPVFYFDRPEGAFYGCPTGECDLVKVARHDGGEPVDDPCLVQRTVEMEGIRPISAFITEAMPQLNPDPVRASTCLYTLSRDGHFIVDCHPDHGNVLFAAGLSGHGFKFSGVLGQAMAELALQGQTEHPVNFLSLKRFQA